MWASDSAVRCLAIFCCAAVLASGSAAEWRIRDGGQVRIFRQEAITEQGRPEILFEKRARREIERREVTRRFLVEVETNTDIRALANEHGLSIENEKTRTGTRWVLFAARDAREVLSVVSDLRRQVGILSAEPILEKQRVRKHVPGDPLYGWQWHLRNGGSSGAGMRVDLNVEPAWDEYRGAGVVIGIVDDGVDTSHPDLRGQMAASLGYDWNDADGDPEANAENGDFHGTACAGAAAAAGDNGAGIAGVAFGAKIAGLRLIAGPSSDVTEADAILFKREEIHVKSNSWGPDDDGARLEGPGPLSAAALEESIRTGRGGLGTIFLWPAGNGRDAGDDANYDGYANSIYTIAVGAVSDQGFVTDYGEPGACVLGVAPSGSQGRPGIATTDLQGAEGLNEAGGPGEIPDGDYTSGFSGTSASTALAAGVVALMLEANPGLGWRDVQEILIRTARMVNPQDADWDVNAAGQHFNHNFGAGLFDAAGAAELAARWNNLAAHTNAAISKSELALEIPDNDSAGVAQVLDFGRVGMRVEHATLEVSIEHPSRGELAVTLVSPSGFESRLAEPHADDNADYEWTFSTMRHWGESAQGEWTIRVADRAGGNAGRVKALTLTLHGTEQPANSLLASGTAVRDASAGNGNGAIEPGETIDVVFALKNFSAEAQSGTARLVSLTPGVTVLSGESAFRLGTGGGAEDVGPEFSYQVGPQVPCGAVLLFDLVTVSDGRAQTNRIRQETGLPPAEWMIATLDREGNVGSHTALAIDGEGGMHVGYYDASNGNLKYMHGAGDKWTNMVVDSAGDVGTHNSIALDGSGRPAISYRDSSDRRLKFAEWDGSSWKIETVHAAVACGSYSALAFGPGGQALIAFQDETNGDLLLARRVGGAWTVETVDSAETTGADISLALNKEGAPAIAYRNVTRADLLFAEWSGSSWRKAIIDSEGAVGFDTSLVFGEDWQPRVAYRDSSNADLKFAQRFSEEWRVEVVDSAGATGFDASLGLDSRGNPSISYRDISNNSLRYAVWTGTAWRLSTVDAQGSVGADSSLVFDARDRARIVYRDISNTDLKFAALDSQECRALEAAPMLSIARSGEELEISWPAPSTGEWVVEWRSDLDEGSSWTESIDAQLIAGRLAVRVNAEQNARFYRLRKR